LGSCMGQLRNKMKPIEQLQTELALWETRRDHLRTSMALAQYQMKDIELELAKTKKMLEDQTPKEDIK